MIHLEPMAPEDFTAFVEALVHEYADDKVRSGNWQPEGAVQRARAEVATLLPEGLATKDHFIYSVVTDAGGEKVGLVWVAVQDPAQPHAFIYDLKIDPAQRRKGYARAAMLAVEERVRALGLDTISLHVFGSNRAAIDLYTSLGYETTNVLMSKVLVEGGGERPKE